MLAIIKDPKINDRENLKTGDRETLRLAIEVEIYK